MSRQTQCGRSAWWKVKSYCILWDKINIEITDLIVLWF